MPISVHSDVTSVLEMPELVKLAEQFDCAGKQMFDGLDCAARSILSSLSIHTNTIDGAEKVFRTVGQFSGQVVENIKSKKDPQAAEFAVQIGANCLHEMLGHDAYARLVDEVSRESRNTANCAANIVGFTAALTLDFLGSYKKKFGLKRDNLKEIIRSQTELTNLTTNPNDSQNTLLGQLGIKPKKVRAQAANHVNTVAETAVEPDIDKKQQLQDEQKTKETLPRVSVPPAQQLDSALEATGSQQESVTQTSENSTTKPLATETQHAPAGSKSQRKWLTLVLLLAACLGICGVAATWMGHTDQPRIGKNDTESSIQAATTKPATIIETATTVGIEAPEQQQKQTSHSELASTTTRDVSLYIQPTKTPTKVNRRPHTLLVRYDDELDLASLSNVTSNGISEEESSREYWWDQRKVSAREGYLRIAAWVVPENPRNSGISTNFSYDYPASQSQRAN